MRVNGFKVDGAEAARLGEALGRFWDALAVAGLDDAEAVRAAASFACAWLVGRASGGDPDRVGELAAVVAEAARAGGEDASSLALGLLGARRP